MYLGADTETTGLFIKKLPLKHPSQPHIVQLAAVLKDGPDKEVASMNRLVKPDGYKFMPKGAQDAHGISFEEAMDKGISLKEVIDEFYSLVVQADTIVAHNINYDMTILSIANARLFNIGVSPMDDKKLFCTMESSKPLVKMPPTDKMRFYGFKGYKPPKLQEAYKFFFNEEFEGAHDANNDIRATLRIYEHLQTLLQERG